MLDHPGAQRLGRQATQPGPGIPGAGPRGDEQRKLGSVVVCIGHGGAHPSEGPATRLPTRPGRPRRSSAAGRRRPPASCSSSRRSRPSATSMARPSSSAATVPGPPADPPGVASGPADGTARAAQTMIRPKDDFEPAAWPGLVRADHAFDVDDARRGIETSVVPTQRPGHGRALGSLRHGRQRTGEPRLDGGRQQVSGGLGEMALEMGAGLGAIERQTASGDDRPAVEAGVHEHQADARLEIAREDGGRDRAGAAMSGQQGRMEVQRARGRQGQDLRWHELAVVGEHEQVGRQPSDRVDGLRASQALGRQGRQSQRSPAVRCTGVGVTVPPRPSGRAGALTTVTTSTEGASTSASRMGTAKAPLPKKTARRRTVTRAVSRAPRPRRRRPAGPGRPG